MNRHVNAIAGRLSLRPPQRRSLEILDRITEIVPPRKDIDAASALATIRSEFPTVTDFEREFPSVCFALATGVGKTRLMGAFISYLHLAHGINNFFVLAPNLTIYILQSVTAADLQKALQVFRRYSDHLFSFVDCTSFVVMERLGITYAVAFDSNFDEYPRLIKVPQEK
jgi:type III restriction enzyme